MLDHYKNMILNATSIYGKVRARTSSRYLLEIISQLILAELISKANAIMKRKGARVNLPLYFIKSLVLET